MASISNLFPRLRTVFSAIGCLLCFGLGSSLRADLDSNATLKLKKRNPSTTTAAPTAVAEAATVDVERGGQVTIHLRGISSGGGRLEFGLTQKPKHGQIVSSKVVGLDRLEIVYRHSGEASAKTDSFLFAVRAGSSGPFSPGVAKIRIATSPGRVMAPDALDFPPTLVGKTATESFVALNEGGVVVRGKMTISPPWRIVGSADFRFGPAEKSTITVEYAPVQSGSQEGQLTLETGGRPVRIALHGEGIPTFLVSPSKLKLQQAADGSRSGVISVQNNTPEPITIEVESTFDLPKTIPLQFSEGKELTVTDRGIGSVESMIRFKNGVETQRIEVRASELVRSPEVASASPTPTPAIASIIPPQPAATPSPTAAPTPAPAEVVEYPTPEPAPTPPPVYAQFISAKLIPASTDSVRIEWKDPKSSGPHAIQQRYLLLDNEKNLKTEWVPVPSAKLSQSGREGHAIIDDLDSKTVFTFRVVQTGSEPLHTSLPLTHRTPPGFFGRISWKSVLYPLAALLIGAVIWKRWQNRESSW